MSNKALNINFFKRNNTYLISTFVAAFIFIDVFQDFIHAKIFNEGFYFSESFIFKSFWFLIIPFATLISVLSNQKRLKTDFLLFFKILLIGVLHIFTSAVIIVGLYSSILNIDFLFLDVFKELLTTKLPLSILILVVITFIIKSKTKKLKKDSLTIKNGRTIYRIEINKILVIEANTPYITIKTKDKKYIYNSSLIKFLAIIDNPNFIRVHKKHIINKKAISKLKSRSNGDYDVVLKNNDIIRLSRTYRQEFFSKTSKDSFDTK